MRHHLDLACVKLNNTQIQLNEIQVQLGNTQVQLMETQVQLNAAQIQLSTTQEVTKKLEEKSEALQRRLEDKIKEDREKETKEKTALVKLTPNGTLLYNWNINNFSEILKQAKIGDKETLVSAPFYTECYGYKLKVFIYPNGNGLLKNSYISAYVFVIKGEYDTILPWPFNRKVRVTLIDQSGDPAKQENIIIEKEINLMRRPKAGECFGCGPIFISHEKMKTRRYLVDDTLFLQFEILPR